MTRRRGKSFRKIVWAVDIYLILGMVCSLVVAWGLAWLPHRVGAARYAFSQLSNQESRFYVYDYRWFGLWERQYSTQRRVLNRSGGHLDPGVMLFWWTWSPGMHNDQYFAQWESFEERYEPVDAGMGQAMYARMSYGWPALCMEASGASNPARLNPNGTIVGQVDSGILLPIEESAQVSPMSQRVLFPYAPVWTGLAINSVFFGLVAFLIRTGLGMIAQVRRFNRGHCPRCDYELSYDFRQGCPECGWRKASSVLTASEIE
ncbi:MAG: hypothetical protein ACWA5W_00780 [Phycisphaerales bacterium]